jgi:nicotinate phosphoribosyltransferase
MAHEWIMAHMYLDSIRHCNRAALLAWQEVFKGSLGIALTDTIGSPAFFADFDKCLARSYDGIRQDSGDPFEFADRAIKHYESVGIDPASKTIIFSDSLNVEKAIAIKEYCGDRIKCAFGIGTNLSNDYPNSPALNIVIKLWSINGVPVVKLSDSPGKTMGDPEAVKVTNWIVNHPGV